MNAIKNWWNNFVEKHPAASKWIREGGLFIIVSNLVTVLKYLILQFLPKMLTGLPDTDFGWPGIDRKSTRLNSSHITRSRMPSSA